MTDISTYSPMIHNDISLEEAAVYTRFENLTKDSRFAEAASLISTGHTDGITASLFNSWEQKLNELFRLLNQRDFTSPYYYSASGGIPSDEEFHNRTIWSEPAESAAKAAEWRKYE